MGFGSGSALAGAAGVGTIFGVGVAVAFGGETASGSVPGAGSEAPSIDTDCPRPTCVITIRLTPKLTKAKATKVMGMDWTTDVSRLNGPPPHGKLVGRLRGSTSLQSAVLQKIRPPLCRRQPLRSAFPRQVEIQTDSCKGRGGRTY